MVLKNSEYAVSHGCVAYSTTNRKAVRVLGGRMDSLSGTILAYDVVSSNLSTGRHSDHFSPCKNFI